MRNLLIGIDSGTQSTKALVVDSRDGKVLASANQAYDLIPDLPPGAKEQHPHTWREAAASAMRQALRQAKAVAADVVAIGVSGQQHGFVPLDVKGEVIRPAKLWCDTSTTAECDEIMEKLGGFKKTVKTIGNAVLPGLMDTPMAISGIAQATGSSTSAVREARNARVPLRGKMGTAWDTAHAALFLASDEANFITGVLLPVDGGMASRVG